MVIALTVFNEVEEAPDIAPEDIDEAGLGLPDTTLEELAVEA